MRPSSSSSSSPTLFLFLILLLLPIESLCSSRQQKLYQFQRALRRKSTDTITAAAAPSFDPIPQKSNGRVFYPIGYGADPTGAEDSSRAMAEAIGDAFGSQNGSQMLPGINDLGGVVIDLQGGNFKISTPLRFPPGIGNILVQRGTLRAADTFPADRHLIELWSPNSQKFQKSATIRRRDNFSDEKDQSVGIYYEDITFEDILFDSGFRGGGLLVMDSARTRVVECFFLHFTTEGILVVRGHETFVIGCFLGQQSTVGGDKREKDFTGTAIDLAGNDNAVTDVAIFSAATGVVVRGQANTITGVHCYNKATFFGGVGMLVTAAQTRIDGCYLDFNSIVIEDPSQVHVTNVFFLGDGNIVLKSIKGMISGLVIVNNMFCGQKPNGTVPIVRLDGGFSRIDQVVIDNNNVNGMELRSTSGRLAVSGNDTARWVADFSGILVFPDKINHVQYSFYSPVVKGFPAHAVTNVSNNVVVVETETAVSGVVSFVVDQSNLVGEGNSFI